MSDDENESTTYAYYEDESDLQRDLDNEEREEQLHPHIVDEENIELDNLTDTEVYRILLRVCDLLNNTKLTQALDLVEKVKRHSLTSLILYAEIIQVRSSMDDSEESFQNCYTLLEKLEQKALTIHAQTKAELSRGEQSTSKDHLEAIVTLAEVNGMMAMMHGRRSNRLKAAHKARRSWKYFEEAEKVLPSIPQWDFELIAQRDCKLRPAPQNTAKNHTKQELEALFGAERHLHVEGDDLRGHFIVSKLLFGSSLFRFGMSILPPSLQWLVEKFGFPAADREEAIAKLDLIGHMPASPRQVIASGALIAIKYFFFDEKNVALEVVNDMITVFPESILFRGILAQLQRREGNYDVSTECFKIAIKYTEEEQLLQATRTLRYELGNNYYAIGRLDEALPLYEHFMNNTTSPTFRAYCGYKYCCCLILVQPEKLEENRSRIMEILKNASTVWVRKEMSYDIWASRLSQQLMRNNLVIGEVQRRLEYATGYVDSHMFDKAREELGALEKILEGKKNQRDFNWNDYAHYLYLRARLLKKTDVDAAIEAFGTLLNTQIIDKVKVEKWIIPHAEMDFAEIMFDKGKYQTVQQILRNCKKRSGYDFEKQLSFMIKRMERKMQQVPAQ